MCGIAGYVAAAENSEVGFRVRKMTGVLQRRGPDSQGFAEWPGVSLGHRRLAILDLSAAGHQPMLTGDGNIGLVFNGCIYNFIELRADLERLGYQFRSHTDTEVLLYGYQAWGIDMLARRLRGMYAFGIWDDNRRKLTLVRDRLGVKPLLLAHQGNEIAFASTAAALRQAGFGKSALDEEAVLEFLEFGFVTDERCIWQGIRKLPPASILEWQDGRVEERRYWALDKIDRSWNISFDEAVEETERLLIESVKLRLFADVPIGVLLSGGIDSSLICWAMAQTNANITAFTVGTPGDPADETGDARETAQRLGIQHEIVTLSEDSPSLELLTDAFSEPFACSSALGMLQVSRAVKPKATVLLTGDGGDDVFLGYDLFLKTWWAQKAAQSLPPHSDAVWRAVQRMVPRFGKFKKARTFMELATGGAGSYARTRDGLPYYEKKQMLGPRLEGRTTAQRQMPRSLEGARRQVQEVFELHHRMHFTSEFMPKVDGARCITPWRREHHF
jgi:asparagine synthase (glutamine-hydrolysing)